MTKAQRTHLRAIILAFCFAPSTGVATAQVAPLISVPFSMNAAGSGPVITLNGQSSCAISLFNAGTGMTLVPQASNDNGATWTTVSTIGGGSISTFGNYAGNVAGAGLTSFRFLITALSSGNVSGNEVCSGAIGLADSGGLIGDVNVKQINGATVGSPTAAGVSATGNILGIQGVTGGVAVPISGAVTGSGNFTVVQPTGTNLHAVLDTTSTTAVTQATAGNLNATVVFPSAQHVIADSGTVNVGTVTTLPAITFAAPQHAIIDSGSVSLSAPVPNPTGTAPATIATPAASASSISLLAANSAANGFTICNASAAIGYAAKAATATASLYTLPFPAQGSVPTCYTETGPTMYRGAWSAISASATGNWIVTSW